MLLSLVSRSFITGKAIGFIRVPSAFHRASRKMQRYVGVGCLAVAVSFGGAAVWVAVLAGSDQFSVSRVYGCDFASAANSWLAGGLVAHGLLFGSTATVYASDKLMLWYHGFLLLRQRQRQGVLAGFFTLASGMCLAGAVVVVTFGRSSQTGGEAGGAWAEEAEDSEGASSSLSPTEGTSRIAGAGHESAAVTWCVSTWQGVGLAAVTLYWSLLFLGSSVSQPDPDDPGGDTGQGNAPPPPHARAMQRQEFMVFGGTLHLAGWVLFALSGFPSFFFTDQAVRLLLGCSLLATAAHHLTRAVSMGAGLQTIVWRNAAMHTAAGSACFPLALLALSSSSSASASGYGVGLGLLLLFDSLCGALLSLVILSGSPLGMLRPLEVLATVRALWRPLSPLASSRSPLCPNTIDCQQRSA